jgi:hypothetical protein
VNPDTGTNMPGIEGEMAKYKSLSAMVNAASKSKKKDVMAKPHDMKGGYSMAKKKPRKNRKSATGY